MSNRFDPADRRSGDVLDAIQHAAHTIATAITQGFRHMADAQTQALADLTAAVQGVADAVATEISALQTAVANANNNGTMQPDDSAAIEAIVVKLNDLTAALKASLPVPTVPPTV